MAAKEAKNAKMGTGTEDGDLTGGAGRSRSLAQGRWQGNLGQGNGRGGIGGESVCP